MAWEQDREESFRSGKLAKSIDRELRRGDCRHTDSKQLVGNFLICKCGRKFIYRLKG